MSSARVAPNNAIFCCPMGSSRYNKMLQPFLLLSLALFVLQCIDAINPKTIFACLCLVTIQDHLRVHQVHIEIEDSVLKSFLSKNRLKQLRRNGARNRVYRQRRSWQKFQSLLTNHQFHRYFWMSRECFALLANKIEQNVGAEVFKSEEYLKRLKCDPNFSYALFNKQKNLLAAHEHLAIVVMRMMQNRDKGT